MPTVTVPPTFIQILQNKIRVETKIEISVLFLLIVWRITEVNNKTCFIALHFQMTVSSL